MSILYNNFKGRRCVIVSLLLLFFIVSYFVYIIISNPPWWWHGIKNITEKSTAVASRWHTNGIAGNNCLMTEENYETDRLSSMLFQIGGSGWLFLHNILKDPSPRFDEHMTLREKKNRFVHLQNDFNKNGGLKVFGLNTKF